MKLTEVARRLACDLSGDGSIEIHGVAPIENAAPGTLTFVANPKYRAHLRDTRASAVLISRQEEPPPLPFLRCDDPYRSFAEAIELFYVPPPLPEGVHPTAVVSPSARIGARARIGPYVVVGDEAVIGDDACLHAHVVVYPQATIGREFVAHAHAVVRERVRIGDRVILHNGAVIGSDGFGYVLGADGKARKIVQAGTVEIGDDVEIGANTTVDRAAVGLTVIEAGAKLDNLVMVAHGCSIGAGTAVAAQSGLSGSTRVGRYVRIGGQVGTAGHLTIGDGAQIAAQSGIHADVTAGKTMGGTPGWEIEVWRRIVAALPRLPELLRRVRRLERDAGRERPNGSPRGPASP